MAEKKTSSAAVWVSTLFLAVVFLAAGWTTLSTEGYDVWAGYRQYFPGWIFYGVGVLEITGAVLLLYPKRAWIGALTLALLMVAAIITLIIIHDPRQAVIPALLLVSLATLTYHRFPRKPPPASAP
jgi:putative oxidoreductase